MTSRSSAVAQRRLELVRSYVARAVLPPLPAAELGDVVLAPHQREAVARLLAVIAEHGGALLADDVGLGKTFVALAVAREYEACEIVAPAALLPMWGGALVRSHTTHARLHSLHSFSRASDAPGAEPSLVCRGRTLVIVDEAHHVRNPSTTRYARLSAALAGADVLLLSATPIHNRARDLRVMLALFAGTRADLLDSERRAELIVRREAGMVREHRGVSREQSSAIVTRRPTVHRHRPHRLVMDEGVLTRIVTLPVPLPAKDGAEAGALIRMGLLRAWCSSDAALIDAVRKRRLRGAVLRDALETGRYPTDAELRSWAVVEGDMQLGFAELLVGGRTEDGALLAVLDRHLTALESLADTMRGLEGLDAVRATWLREVMARNPGVPVVAFSQYAKTVEAMYRALGDIAGVGMLTGSRARIASGPIARMEALHRFAPRAHERPPPPVHQAIRLLLTTDILAEGVNLQDAGVVVHLDLPWTAALRDQRVGRCARMGSRWPSVAVYSLAPSLPVERVIRLERRVARKAATAARAVGRAGAARSVVETQSLLLDLLRRWTPLTALREPDNANSTELSRPGVRIAEQRVALAAGWELGALVVVRYQARDGEISRFLSAVRRDGRWVVRDNGRTALSLVRVASRGPLIAVKHELSSSREAVRELVRLVRRWLARAQARAIAGDSETALSDVQRQAYKHLAAAVEQLGVTERARLAASIARCRDAIRDTRSSAAELALREWLARSASSSASWLDSVPQVRGRRPVGRELRSSAKEARASLTLLLLSPPPPVTVQP